MAFVQANGFGGFAARAIAELIPKLKARGVTGVIDVGCGAGVTTKALLEAGFETLAIEPSPALLAIAREAAKGAEFRLASAYEMELPACDAVLAVGEPLTYHRLDSHADTLVRHFFRQASRALRGGGLLIFDVIESDGEPLDGRGWASGSDWAVLYESSEDRSARHLIRRVEVFRLVGDGVYRRSEEIHSVRLFDRCAIATWLAEEGFDVEVDTSYGRVELATRRIAFTATKRG